MLQGDPSWSSERLWQEIKGEAVRGANDGNLNFLMPEFAALLIKLSIEADRRARHIIYLTWGLCVFTVALDLNGVLGLERTCERDTAYHHATTDRRASITDKLMYTTTRKSARCLTARLGS